MRNHLRATISAACDRAHVDFQMGVRLTGLTPFGRQLSKDSVFKNLCVGAFGEMGTPLPIPNREVKHLSVDGTRAARPRESRTAPTQRFLEALFLLSKI